MDRNFRRIMALIILLSILGIIVTYILGQDFYFSEIFKKTGEKLSVFSPFSSTVCGSDTSYVNCSKIKESPYSVLFGRPLSFWGLFYFIVMAVFSSSLLLAKERFRDFLSILYLWFLIFGSTFVLVYFFISIFIIRALCSLCVATYLVNWISLGLFSFYFFRNRLHTIKFSGIAVELIKKESSPAARFILVSIFVVMVSALAVWKVNATLMAGRETFIEEYKKAEYDRIVKEFSGEEKVKLNVKSSLIIGSPDAPVEIVEFSDFLCPYCSHAARAIHDIMKEKPGMVRVVFLNYPLDIECNRSMNRQLHAGACLIARGSISAARQGKFEVFHDIAFQTRVENPGNEHMKKLADIAGLDPVRFFSDLELKETLDELKAAIETADKLGITSTPTLFINGKKFKYKPARDLLDRIISQEYNAIMKARLEKK